MTDRPFLRTTWFLAVLLAIGAALFAVGVASERRSGDHHTEQSATAVTVHVEASAPGAEGGTESGTEGGSESTPHIEGTSTEPSAHSEASEKLFGINAESNGVVAVAVALSLALALLVVVRPRRPVFVLVAGFAVLFAAFDIVEVVHQINNSRPGVAAIAVVLTLVHAVAALLSMKQRSPVAIAG